MATHRAARSRRRLLALSLLLALPGLAGAEEPAASTAVESPEAPPPAPPPAPSEVVHRGMIGFEAGWNGLTGVGLTGSWRPGQHLSLDASAGMGALTPRGGLRLRYIGGDGGTWAFTGGLGVMVQGAYRGEVAEAPGPAVPFFYLLGFGTRSVNVSVGTTALAQAVVGWQLRKGRFDGTLLVGWAQVVAGNHLWSEEPLTAEQRGWLRSMLGSGPVVTLTIGLSVPRSPRGGM